MQSYLNTAKDVYKQAALTPDEGLCCTTTPMLQLPSLDIPDIMKKMNYGCGTTVCARDLVNDPTILYVGVGGGMELLQFSYYNRQAAGVIGIDPVEEMLEASRKNLLEAEKTNEWFSADFVDLRKGDALQLPVEDASIDVAAQNCLFNIFQHNELRQALSEMYRVLKPNGRLVMSDPVSDDPMSDELRADEKLRALCLSGSLPMSEYIRMITEIGFGTVEIRAKRPYRILSPTHYATDRNIFIESIEVCAIKDPMPSDGACVFTGKTATYFGKDDYFDDNNGHLLMYNQPLSICDKTAESFVTLNRADIHITPSTFFYDGGGCC